MSQENLDLVIRALGAAVKRPEPDFETVNALFHPDHAFVPITARRLGDPDAKGASGYRAWLEGAEEEMPYETDLEGAVDTVPGKVLVVTMTRLRGASSGIDIEERIWLVVTVEEGKITRTEAYADPGEALEAAGQRE